jgi:hypothetical protein
MQQWNDNTTDPDELIKRLNEITSKINDGAEPAQPPQTAATAKVLHHLEEVAEKAIGMQCAVIRELVVEAQLLDNLLVADLARIRETLRVGINTGARAAALAQQIRDAMAEMKSAHGDLQVQT